MKINNADFQVLSQLSESLQVGPRPVVQYPPQLILVNNLGSDVEVGSVLLCPK